MLKITSKTLKIREEIEVLESNVFIEGCKFRPDKFVLKVRDANTWQDNVFAHIHGDSEVGSGNNFAHDVLLHGIFMIGNCNFFGYRMSGNDLNIGSNNYFGHSLDMKTVSCGDNNIIRGDSMLRGCNIGSEAYLGPMLQLVGVDIEDGVTILRGAKIIAETGKRIRIGKGAVIGECVEIKENVPAGACILPRYKVEGRNWLHKMLCKLVGACIHPHYKVVVAKDSEVCKKKMEYLGERKEKIREFVKGIWHHYMHYAVVEGLMPKEEYIKYAIKLGY